MASIAKATGRVLVQLGEDEPVEVGTIEIPIDVGTQPIPARRGGPAARLDAGD
ncbi:hypothetical protein [Mycetocola reblochoni]|uniref:hypothetical protein n=1 Tax=Mycetocola reblochoni TaxID=331618 RepID=UPI003F97FAA5